MIRQRQQVEPMTSGEQAGSTRRNPYVFLVGCQRSGTTLLQRMLDHHPQLAVGYDSHFIPKGIKGTPVGVDPPLTPEIIQKVRTFPRFARLGLSDADSRRAAADAETYGQFVTALYNEFGRLHGKPLAGEKSPGYCRHLPRLHALFPWARTIHLIRDGRDVALSILDWRKGPAKLKLFREEPVGACALWWRRDVVIGRRDGARLGADRYLEVIYELLVARPEETLREIVEFLRLPYDAQMAAYHEGKTRTKPGLSTKAAWLPPTTGLRDWRTQMAERDVELFEAIAGDTLLDAGYERAFEKFSPRILHAARSCRDWWAANMERRPKKAKTAVVRSAAARPPAKRGGGENPYVFIVGCPRSGTTLLKRMVDAHPQIAITPETHWIPRYFKKRVGLTPEGLVTPDLIEKLLEYHKFSNLRIDPQDVHALVDSGPPVPYADFVSGIFELYSRRQNKRLVGDKTPGYVQEIPLLHDLWPQAKFVHLIRDGRDVCLSVLDWDRAYRSVGRFGTWHEDPLSTAALWWERHVRLGREAAAALDPQLCCEIRYESLVTNPADQCARLCDFLDLPFDEAMLHFHEGRTKDDHGLSAKKAWRPLTPGLRDWRSQMAEEDVQRFEAAAGDLLDELGYPRACLGAPAETAQHAARIRDQFTKDPHFKERWRPKHW